MNSSKLAFLDERPEYRLQEDRGVYDAHHAAAEEHAEHLYESQGQVGEALNLAGLLLTALENESDGRAMQIHTAVQVIEKKLKKAYNRLDRHDAQHTKLFLAYAELRDKAGEIEPG